MSDLLILEWSRDRLSALVVSGETRGTVRKAVSQASIDHADPLIPVAQAGDQLHTWLMNQGISTDRARVVLPRDAVVIRRLQLPEVPADELPDLVRFQTATRTSSSIESQQLDFLTLPVLNPGSGQEVVCCSIDRDQITRIQSVCQAAKLNLESILISPLTIAELVRSSNENLGLESPDLVVYQQGSRLEISVFAYGSLIFSHATQLTTAEDVSEADRVKPFKSDLTRSLVTLSQTQSESGIGRCFYVRGERDHSIEELLTQKFPDAVQAVTAAELFSGIDISGYESLAGAAIKFRDDRLKIDLLHPRKKKEVPDRRRLYYGLTAVVAMVTIGLGTFIFYSKKGTLEDSIQLLRTDVNSKQEQLKKDKPKADAFERLARWKESDTDPIEIWNEFRGRLGGTDRIYFTELRVTPSAGEIQSRIVGRGHAKTRTDVDALNQTLSDSGYRVRPAPPTEGNRDPDYSWDFALDIELPRPLPTVSKPATPAPASPQASAVKSADPSQAASAAAPANTN